MKTTVITMLILLIGMSGAYARETEKKKVKEIEIKTSAVCSMCKDRIEEYMAYEKGVKEAILDLETKVLTIKYKTQRTTPDELRKAVTKIGYDADDLEADPKAYEKLPACCKKDATPH